MALVLLLRGVNVGGHRTFRPKRLAEDLAHLGAVNVGAAGTFVVRGKVTQAKLRAEVTRRLPFMTTMMICNGRDILRLVAQDPLAKESTGPGFTKFVSALARRPGSAPELPLVLPSRGPWQLRLVHLERRFVCGIYRRNMKAIGYLGEVDRVFGMAATTRNWNTIMTIAKVLRG